MNRIERDKQRSRMKKQIDDIMRNNPEYARRHKEEQEDNVMRAFRTFILISVDYLERFCGFGNKRILILSIRASNMLRTTRNILWNSQRK